MHRYRVTFVSSTDVIRYWEYAESETVATERSFERLGAKVGYSNIGKYVWIHTVPIE